MQRGQSGVKARESARELSSAAQRLQRFDGVDEREQGGLGGQETARSAMATRRSASGRGREVGDDAFAESPLPPLCFFFLLFPFQSSSIF